MEHTKKGSTNGGHQQVCLPIRREPISSRALFTGPWGPSISVVALKSIEIYRRLGDHYKTMLDPLNAKYEIFCNSTVENPCGIRSPQKDDVGEIGLVLSNFPGRCYPNIWHPKRPTAFFGLPAMLIFISVLFNSIAVSYFISITCAQFWAKSPSECSLASDKSTHPILQADQRQPKPSFNSGMAVPKRHQPQHHPLKRWCSPSYMLVYKCL